MLRNARLPSFGTCFTSFKIRSRLTAGLAPGVQAGSLTSDSMRHVITSLQFPSRHGRRSDRSSIVRFVHPPTTRESARATRLGMGANIVPNRAKGLLQPKMKQPFDRPHTVLARPVALQGDSRFQTCSEARMCAASGSRSWIPQHQDPDHYPPAHHACGVVFMIKFQTRD